VAGSNGTKPARARRRGVPSSAPADAATIEAALRREIQVANDNLGLLAARLEEAAAGDSPFTSTAPRAAAAAASCSPSPAAVNATTWTCRRPPGGGRTGGLRRPA